MVLTIAITGSSCLGGEPQPERFKSPVGTVWPTIRSMIRGHRSGDVDAIAELYERSFATLSFLPRLHTLEQGRAWFGQVVRQRETWVWEDEGAILGFIILGDATVDYLYVEPEMTGRGIGSALLDQAKGSRPAGFCLWTFQQNEGARRFYERHGLRLIRLTDGEENEEKTPAALYAWRTGGRQP
jgi:ribosomal protein S18 acetylase RimI-like enzyme